MSNCKVLEKDPSMNGSLFERISCPLCGEAAFDVVKPGCDAVNAEELRKAYNASSKHQLLGQVVRCRSCTLHFVNPRPVGELILQSYASGEDATFVSQNDNRVNSFRKVLRRVLSSRSFKDGKGLRFLDIGCAGGASLEAARSLGFEPIGIEPNRWMADFGRRTYGVQIRDGILEPGMFPPESFEVITLWDVLEHLPHPRTVLQIICDLLRPNGTLIVSYPDFASVMGRILRDRWPFWLTVHLLYYDRRTIGLQLKTCGLHEDFSFSYWPTLALGYAFDRATDRIPGLKPFRSVLRTTGLDKMPLTYNMGQRVVVATKQQ
jgi:SAM-dependent methyltransferase